MVQRVGGAVTKMLGQEGGVQYINSVLSGLCNVKIEAKWVVQ